MDVLNSLFNLLTDSKEKVYSKATVVLIILTLLFIADNIFGFSYYYNTGRKIEQVKAISSVLEDQSIPLRVRNRLLEMQRTTIEREHILDKSISYLESFTFPSTEIEHTKQNQNYEDEEKDFWHSISSAGVFLLFWIIAIPLVLFSKGLGGIVDRLLFLVALAVLVFVISSVYSTLFGLIPKIGETWTYNYVLNSFLQFLSLGYIIFRLKKGEEN